MARIVVVGGGFGGCASAVRLAKLGHQVTLLEATPRIGGAIGTVEHDGFVWQTGPTHTLLPAVVRDLYVKSGRKIEREFDLVPTGPTRHVFADGSEVDLPAGSRAEQKHALDQLGSGLGQAWLDWVRPYADVWAALRRDLFERPYDAARAAPSTRELLKARESLEGVARTLPDPRLTALATSDAVVAGHRPRRVPAWWGLQHYLRQTFDTWTVPAEQGGMARLADSLAARLATRRVDVHTQMPVLDIALERGRLRGVHTASGLVAADRVVVAVDPRQLPSLRRFTRRATAALPPHVIHLGLAGDPPGSWPHEVVLHGGPHLVVRPGGGGAWTVLAADPGRRDPLEVLAERGLDLRPLVTTRIDHSPADQIRRWRGSPLGVAWAGRATVRHRLGTNTPIEGVHLSGAHASLGSAVPYVGLSAALVAQQVGPAR